MTSRECTCGGIDIGVGVVHEPNCGLDDIGIADRIIAELRTALAHFGQHKAGCRHLEVHRLPVDASTPYELSVFLNNRLLTRDLYQGHVPQDIAEVRSAIGSPRQEIRFERRDLTFFDDKDAAACSADSVRIRECCTCGYAKAMEGA